MAKKLDRLPPFFLPVDISQDKNRLTLSALGEEVRFEGRIFSADCSAPLDISVGTEDGERLAPVCIPACDGLLKEYCYFDGVWRGVDEIVAAETTLSGIGVFLRRGGVSFFLSLDFPYCRIERDGMSARIGCDPLDPLKAGERYRPHTLTIGAAALTGERIGLYDRGEIEAFSEYILSRMPANFRGERPIFSTTCITNRMTDVRDGRIFYSMYDNPTLTLDLETLKAEVRLCAELGIEYDQVFEGYFDWEEDGSSEKAMKELVALGRDLGVRVGGYMTAIGLYCWHYNYRDREIADKTMCAMRRDGSRGGLCYGDERVPEFLERTIVESIRRNGDEMICLDGNAAELCFDPAHGHVPGSLYAHIRGLVRFMSSMNAVSPFFMTWSNAGNWLEFMPKLLWYNQNVYLTDPHPREYSPALNNLKYYGDCRREQMVTVHNKYFVPYSAFTNCEYYAFRHSRVDDAAFFEYSFLQGLAVTPNICLGELRTFLERTASSRLEYVKGFMKKWLRFIRDNIDSWKNVLQLGDSPGVGANEAYAHINGDHGFICLVNQNPSSQTFSFSLDGSIGLVGCRGDRYLLSEVYPGEYPIAEQPLPGPLYGEKITLSTPGYSVRFVKIAPYEAPADGIRLYGISGSKELNDGSVTYTISAECGKSIPAAIWFENGAVSSVSAETVPTVPKYTFPTDICDLHISGCAARFTLKMPRDRFERELSLWSVDGSAELYRLDQSNSDFCGAYIHNLYREDQHTRLTVSVGHGGSVPPTPCGEVASPGLDAPAALIPPKRRAAVYETTMDIPFIEWPAMSTLYGFDELVELVFADSLIVDGIRAYIDGRPVPVHEYRYPPDPTMKGFYIELTGEVSSGTRPKLRIEVDWNGENRVRHAKSNVWEDGAQVVGRG